MNIETSLALLLPDQTVDSQGVKPLFRGHPSLEREKWPIKIGLLVVKVSAFCPQGPRKMAAK